jgi:hypothetical protein
MIPLERADRQVATTYGRDPTEQQRAWLSGEQGTHGHYHASDQAQRASRADEPPDHVRGVDRPQASGNMNMP